MATVLRPESIALAREVMQISRNNRTTGTRESLIAYAVQQHADAAVKQFRINHDLCVHGKKLARCMPCFRAWEKGTA